MKVIVTICFAACFSLAQDVGPGDKTALDPYQSPFRYVVTADSSDVQKSSNRNEAIFGLEVLMEDRAFNEENLTTLFSLLSRRYSDRPTLLINVFTSMEAIRTPEEYDRARYWGPVADYKKFKYALFSRNGYGERFSYGIPGKITDKEVIIKKP